jgi:hypothetical protein
MQSLMKQINLLNCILLIGILAFGIFVLRPLITKEVKVPLSAATSKTTEQKKETVDQAINPPLQEYAVVAEKNLFHPDRIIPAKKEDIAIPRPEFALYGTLITDTVRIAYISDTKVPRTTPGRGQRQTGLKIGETMSGYTLREVFHDRVVMVHGDDRIEIKIIGHDSKKKRGAAESATPAPPAPTPAVAMPMQPPVTGAIPAGLPQTESPGRMRSRR